ncbi:conserved Plasmodium protein, unknown function [Plasmodium sp.]|nr:conserved Plasmodium protein, unknown function [Plasmodium sp.]
MDNGIYWRLKNNDMSLELIKYIEEDDIKNILNYEGLLQEIKSENFDLLKYIVKEENLMKILCYILEESDESNDYDKSYKFPYKCHQIICCENKLIIDSIVYNDKLMKYFWGFILNKKQLNEVLSGYFSRCAISIYNKNTKEVVNFLRAKKDNLNGNFVNHNYITCDREDNITCLIRDMFVRKSEIYYFNYFLIDLSSQLSFTYLTKCIFSQSSSTISAAITIISDLIHYTVLAKSYNNIDFYECLDIYNKEEEFRKKEIEHLRKKKLTDKRRRRERERGRKRKKKKKKKKGIKRKENDDSIENDVIKRDMRNNILQHDHTNINVMINIENNHNIMNNTKENYHKEIDENKI